MGVALGFGIAGAVVVLLGTVVLSGNQWRCVCRLFNRMSRRWGEIEKGLKKLLDGSKEKRELGEGDSGFEEILRVIAERRPDKKHAEISAIICGVAWGERGGKGSLTHENILLRPKGESPSHTGDLLATKDTFEQWLHDARARSLSHLGFVIVLCGVVLGLVSLIMQAIGSRSC